MRFMMVMVTVLLVFFCSTREADAQTRIGFGTTIVYPRRLVGSGPPLEPTIGHTVVLIQPFSRVLPLSFTARLGFTTPVTAFQPAPQAQVGLIYRMHRALLVGGSFGYRYVPAWDANPTDAHLLTAALALVFLHGSGIGFGLPFGVSHNLSTQGWSAWLGVDVIVLIL